MSSTNRGADRHVSDYYVTPRKAILEFLGAWLQDLEEEDEYNFVSARPDKARWLDPCAGGDETHPMAYPAVITEELGAQVTTVDVRKDSPADYHNDYLKKSFTGFDVIITNPPFYAAKEIIEKALKEVNDNGYVVMLLRLNFLGSKARYEFWQDNIPKTIYVHHQRMSFTEDNKTDSIEYAHFVWQKGHKGPTTLEVI